MSLINQALRKAQRDRTPERMPTGEAASGGHSGAPYGGASRASGSNPILIIGVVLTLAVLIGLVVGLTIVLLKSDTSHASPQDEPSAPPQQLAVSEEVGPKPLAPPSPATDEPIVPQMTPPANTQDSEDHASDTVLEQLREARKAAETKALAEAQTADEATKTSEAPPAADTQPDLSGAVVEWLGASKITGVRLAGDNSRVILNGEAFSVGETVNLELGLRVLVIQENRILFEDSAGKKYMKRL